MRGALADAYDTRGHHQSDLVYAYSPRMEADVILRSALEYAHFLLVESDPSIQRADYSPAPKVCRLCGESLATVVDVEVVDLDGVVTWREVKYTQSLGRGADLRSQMQLQVQQRLSKHWAAHHLVLTEKEIFSNPLRIQNWNRVVAWMAQAREHSLSEYATEVRLLIRARKSIRFAEVLSLGEATNSGLYAAALFKGVQRGIFASDLDQAPLSLFSTFHV